MPQVAKMSTEGVPRSGVDRGMRRRDAIGLAVLVTLGLITSEPGRDWWTPQRRKRSEKKIRRARTSRVRAASAAKWSMWHKITRGQIRMGRILTKRIRLFWLHLVRLQKSHWDGYYPWC